MRKTSTLAVCGILSLSMAASVLSGCGDKAVDGSQTAMIIDGEELSLGLANYFLRTEQATTYTQMKSMMAYFGGDENHFWSTEGEDGLTYGESMKETMVTEMTKLLAIRKHAEELGVSVSDEERQKIQEAAAAFMEKNAEAMEKLGVTVENVEEALELKTLEILIKPVIVKDADRNVSDEEAAQTTCTYIRLKKPDDVKDQETAKAQMEDILKQVQEAPAGSDCKEIATAVNEECYAAQYNYNKDAYDDENNVLDGAVKDVLKNLKENEVYDQVIEGESYYYIVRMDHLFDKEKTNDKKESIIVQRENELYTTTVDGWAEGMTAETKDCWDKLVVDDSEEYAVQE